MALPKKYDFNDYDNYLTDPNPTTSAEAQDYFRNIDSLVGALIDAFLWQPETNYANGDVVKSDSMPDGTEAVCVSTNGGKSSNVEPQWGNVGGENIADGTCFWKLRWEHWSKEIATQSQAEAGMDNTTAMTPLRTAQELDSKRPIKTFTSLGQLGLDNNASEVDIVNAMPSFSMAIIDLPASTQSYPNFSLKRNGLLLIHKMTYNVSVDMEFIHYEQADVIRRYTASYTGWLSAQPFSGWKRVGMHGALSMPSNQGVNVSVTVGIYWSTYQAPADGWLYIRCANGSLVVRNADNDARLDDSGGSESEPTVLFPASKGTNLQIHVSTTPTSARFFYAQSEV